LEVAPSGRARRGRSDREPGYFSPVDRGGEEGALFLAECATFLAAVFTGAAVYVWLVEHPARLTLPTDAAAGPAATGRRTGHADAGDPRCA
jgi:hypothetical protein